jgi:hypothetical protein
MSETETQFPPEEIMAFIGQFLDYMAKTGWITIALLIDKAGKYHPINATNFDGTTEEKQEVLKTWMEAMGKADAEGTFVKKEVPRVQ